MHMNSPAAVASFTSKNLVFTHADTTGLPLSRNGTADSKQSRSTQRRRRTALLKMMADEVSANSQHIKKSNDHCDRELSKLLTDYFSFDSVKYTSISASLFDFKKEELWRPTIPSIKTTTANNNPKLPNMPAIPYSASAQSSMFPRAQALSMASPKSQAAFDTRAESPASSTSESSSKSTASILSQQSMTASALIVGNKFI
ncbi:hypothetical protein BJ741DRAFT_711962 [Chytriomyces cf. hyalinus JEL632]|nr:hypothetical protein BJ741DRAFT_711962 [Chytriomyces cf. hyalinus JEL632]